MTPYRTAPAKPTPQFLTTSQKTRVVWRVIAPVLVNGLKAFGKVCGALLAVIGVACVSGKLVIHFDRTLGGGTFCAHNDCNSLVVPSMMGLAITATAVIVIGTLGLATHIMVKECIGPFVKNLATSIKEGLKAEQDKLDEH